MLALSSSEDYFLEEADSNIQANLEDAVVQEALRSGVDLREYSRQVEEELKAVENESIQDYIRESQNIASLHNQVVECDRLLERMERMLLSFQTDLGSISSEILSLQQQSVQMNLKLRNRQAVRGELTQFLDEMIIPEEMIMVIMDTAAQDGLFLENLRSLEHKINFLKEQSFRDAKSCGDVSEIVDKLKARAVVKVREFLLEKINLFKKPMTNYHIPQNTILRFGYYYKFLMANNRDVAKEVKEVYVDTMSKVLFSYFKSYSGRLLKLQYEEPAGAEDLMGADDGSNQAKLTGAGFFAASVSAAMSSGRSQLTSQAGGGAKAGGPRGPKRASVFSMGQRHEVLRMELESPMLVPHAFEQSGVKCPYEKLFRSEQYCLMENACREYHFLTEFFMARGDQLQDLFTQVLSKTLHLLTKNVGTYAQDSYDSIALFLCLHLVNKFRQMSKDKDVEALDSYWSSLYATLFQRLQTVIKLNVQSIKDWDPQKTKALDLRPHYVTRRFAEFSSTVIGINEGCKDVALTSVLGEMEAEIENFVLKMASSFSQRKDQLIFIINNYDIILSILTENTSGESKEAERFRTQFSGRIAEYVEEVLQPFFIDLICFVKEAESLKDDARLKSLEPRVKRIVGSFNKTWKASLDSVNKEVLGSFPNFKNGTAILQQALTQFVQYYSRFYSLMSHPALSGSQFGNQLINVHQLMVEVKKNKPNF